MKKQIVKFIYYWEEARGGRSLLFATLLGRESQIDGSLASFLPSLL